MKIDFDKAAESVLCETAVFGRGVARKMQERNISLPELVLGCPHVPARYLELLVEGQPPYPLRLEWKREIIRALGFSRNRGKLSDLSDADCDILVQSESPWQKETLGSSPEQGSLL